VARSMGNRNPARPSRVARERVMSAIVPFFGALAL